MASVVLYFQVHQPQRLRRYSVFDTEQNYFDSAADIEACQEMARRCYQPANLAMLEIIRASAGRFRVAYSISGLTLEQLQQHAPEVVDTFRQLAATGCVEFLAETYHHSLAFLYSREEFREQLQMHRHAIRKYFGQEPRVFRNTELIYNNDLAHFVSHMGYEAVLAEGADQVLGYRSPNFVYRPPHASIKLLLRNYRLSDDIATRFGDRSWEQWPLTAAKFASWVNQINGNGYICNLFFDYSMLGRPGAAASDILGFLRDLPAAVLAGGSNDFLTPSQACDGSTPVAEIDVPQMTSWGGAERDLSPWLGNAMQSNALHLLYRLEGPLKERNDPRLLDDWRRLTASDHFAHMATRAWTDPDPENADTQSLYESPYETYINFMNVLDSLQTRVREPE